MITAEQLQKAFTYAEYQNYSQERFALNKTTGEAPEVNTEFYLHYTKLNLSRTSRVEKKVLLTDELIIELQKINQPQTWVVIVESWCGDVPHNLPIIDKMTEIQPLVELHILLRDENLEVMDKYLTNGGRSIPKLIAFSENLEKELFTWGPRPHALQNEIDEWKAEGLAYPEVAEKSQQWYNKNKGEDLQKELLKLLKAG